MWSVGRLTLMNELDKFTPAAPVPHTTQLPKKKGPWSKDDIYFQYLIRAGMLDAVSLDLRSLFNMNTQQNPVGLEL